MSETYSRKRYVSGCPGCDGLFESARADQVACSPACRVRIHRQPGLVAELRALAAAMRITVALGQQGAALLRLCPELEAPIMAGTLTIEDAQPQVLAAFNKLVLAHAQRLHESVTPEAAEPDLPPTRHVSADTPDKCHPTTRQDNHPL